MSAQVHPLFPPVLIAAVLAGLAVAGPVDLARAQGPAQASPKAVQEMERALENLRAARANAKERFEELKRARRELEEAKRAEEQRELPSAPGSQEAVHLTRLTAREDLAKGDYERAVDAERLAEATYRKAWEGLPADYRATRAMDHITERVEALKALVCPDDPGGFTLADDPWLTWRRQAVDAMACLIAAGDLGRDLREAGVSPAALQSFFEDLVRRTRGDPALSAAVEKIRRCVERGKAAGAIPRDFELNHVVYHRAAEKKREEAFVAGMFAGLPLAFRLRECPGEGCEVKKEVEKSSGGGAGR